ncbi:MAG: glycerol-3-phosphate dehydrogenase, partial [Clostridia bacterium]|nr:glycerol-3-phosphate dehydrogenase [Clostridia bacterium]
FTEKNLNIYAVGGPCTSYELAAEDPTEVVFCGPDMKTLRWLKSLFETEYYHISLSTDVHGVECAVALKNAYALGVALAIGLSYKREGKVFEHYNSQAGLFMQASREMYLLLDAFDSTAERNIFVGIGDLYVTVFGGRNRKLGALLGQGYTYRESMARLPGVTMEGVVISKRTARAVEQLASLGKLNIKDFPLLRHIKELLEDEATVNIPWESFETEYEG